MTHGLRTSDHIDHNGLVCLGCAADVTRLLGQVSVIRFRPEETVLEPGNYFLLGLVSREGRFWGSKLKEGKPQMSHWLKTRVDAG